MNGTTHLCPAALLAALASVAVAGTPMQEAPPSHAPVAEKTADQSDASNAPGSKLRQEIDQSVDAIRSFSAERRDEAAADARRAAEELDRQMARLQAQTEASWSRMSQAARTRSQATMTDLRQRRNALAEWYGGMRHSSTAAWGEVRTGFVTSYHELAQALRKARTQFENDEKDDRERSSDTSQREDAP